nr:hypothetical protein [Marmoricola sp. URHB0036]
MAAPDPPPVVDRDPEVGDDEGPAAVFAEHGGFHPDPLQHDAEVVADLELLLLDLPRVHHVVRQHLDPGGAGHDGRRRVDQHECEVLGQDVDGQCGVARQHDLVEVVGAYGEVVRGERHARSLRLGLRSRKGRGGRGQPP